MNAKIKCLASSLVAACAISVSANARPVATITPAQDSTSVLHNPMMGLTTYFEFYSPNWTYKPEWIFDDSTLKYTNILYFRVNWLAMEPTEGHYSWIEHPDLVAILNAAKQHGFRVAWRVIFQDHATPDWVIQAIRNAGQNPYSTHQTFGPGPTDSIVDLQNKIWQSKFQAFVNALGKAFDDPTITDYIDMNGLALWGEGNAWLEGFTDVPKEQPVYFDWHTGVFDQAFKRVVLADNMGFNNDIDLKYGLAFRRDGLGSIYVDSSQINFASQHFPQSVVIGEKCYALADQNGWSKDTKVIAKADSLKQPVTLQTYLEFILDQGFAMNANTLGFQEAGIWTTQGAASLRRAVMNLGYRLRPSRLEYPASTTKNDTITIDQKWVNDGVGALPNNDKRWNKKYAIAYALFTPNGATPSEVVIDSSSNPGDFIKGQEFLLHTKIRWNVRGGTYKLGVGIIDKTRPNDSSLALAIANPNKRNGWYLLGDLEISDDVIPSNLISKNKPVFASPSAGASTLVDGGFGTSNWKLDANSWSAIHLGTGPRKIMVLWSQSATNWSDSAYPSQRCAEGFGVFSKYDILTSVNSTNGSDGDWTLQTTVSRNSASARAHVVDFVGQSWIKIRATSGAGSLDEIQVFDATNTPNDGVFMIGTSITAISERQFPTDSSVSDMIHARDPRLTPPVINGGVVCIASWEVVAGLSNYLAMSSPLRYWAIELGTNDGWGGGGSSYTLTTYAHNLQTIIDSAKSHGIVPILARPPATNPAYTAGGPWQLDAGFPRVVDSLRFLNHLPLGPDLYNHFLAHPDGIRGDGVHPNQAGALAIRRLWAEAILAADKYGAPTSAISSLPRRSAKASSRILGSGLLEVTSPASGPVEITIHSISGTQLHYLMSYSNAKQTTTVDLNLLSLKSGIYLVRVQTNASSETIKFVR